MRRLMSVLAGVLAFISFTAYAEDAATDTKFTLTTNAFLDEGILPVLYTCDGKDASPQFSWTNVPAKASVLALIVTDKDAPGGEFYHLVLFNIPKTTTELPEGMTKPPAGAEIAKNSFDKAAYNGPCPPKGSSHNYTFTLYALDAA